MKARVPAFIACLLVGYSTARAEAVNLDEFIGGIEKADSRYACQESAGIAELRTELRLRYFPFPNEQRSTKVKFPAKFAAAFGKEKVETNKSEGFRRVHIQVNGLYRGFRVRGISFESGIENGTNFIRILFANPKEELAAVFGPDLAQSTPLSWGEAEIVSRRDGAELVCDLSS